MTDILHLNAYSQGRTCGGPEEGGWWYNYGMPLASIPILAKRVKGHPSYCGTCERARRGKDNFCKVDFFDDSGYPIPVDEDYFDPETKIVQHLVPIDPALEELTQHLKNCFEEEYSYGDIYSVLGGSELIICIEDHPAEAYPEKRPRYE